MRAKAITSAAMISAALLATPAAAQGTGSHQTRDYVEAAGQSDALEMMEARTALTQSHDPKVRDYAQRMIRDHGRMLAALTEATQRAGLAPPPTIIGAERAPYLAALQGVGNADFDKMYWKQQALAHRAALVTTRDYAAKGDDVTVKRAAAAAVPTIEAHLAVADKMAGASL